MREKSGAPSHQLGEAMTTHGLCRVATFQARAGLAEIREGLSLMEANQSASGRSFYAKGLRALEKAGELLGNAVIQQEARTLRIAVAKKVGADDQARIEPNMSES